MRNFIVGLALILGGGISAQAQSSTLIWNGNMPRGQWYAHGEANMDSWMENGNETALLMDWTAAPKDVAGGMVYENREEGAIPLPKPHGFTKLTVEARAEVEDGVTLAPEWFIQKTDTIFRVTPDKAARLTPTWTKYVFDLPSDFPLLDTTMQDQVDGLRMLLMKPADGGKNTITIRNVTLEP